MMPYELPKSSSRNRCRAVLGSLIRYRPLLARHGLYMAADRNRSLQALRSRHVQVERHTLVP